MSRSRLLASATALLLLAAGFGPVHADVVLGDPTHAGKPLTFDEVLTEQRRIEGARFSPDGTRIAYGMTRNDAPTGGLAFPITAHSAFLADLLTGRSVEVGKGGGGAQEAAYLQPCEPWRPDSGGVAVIVLKDGAPIMAYADAATGRLTPLGQGSDSLCSIWVGSTMVYATSQGGPPGGWESRRSLAWLTHRWETAWSGGPAQTTVHSNNPAFPAPLATADAGGLVAANTRTGLMRHVADGRYVSLVASPDGRSFAAIREGATAAGALNVLSGRLGELQLFRVEAGAVRRVLSVPDFDTAYLGMKWSPDGRKLLFGGKGPEGVLALRVADIEGGTVQGVPVPDGVSLANASAGAREPLLPLGWIGGAPAFVGETAMARARAAEARSDYGQNRVASRGLYRIAGVAEALTAFSKTSVEGFASTLDGDALVVADATLWRLTPGGQPPKPIVVPDHTVTGLFASPGALGGHSSFLTAGEAETERVVVTAIKASGEPVRIVVRLVDGKVVYSAPASGLSDMTPGLDGSAIVRTDGWTGSLGIDGAGAREIVAANPDWRERPLGETRKLTYEVEGQTLTSWVLLPPGYSGGTLPTIVWVYGGEVFGNEPPGAARPDTAVTPVFNGQLWAANGYAVLYPSTPIGQVADLDVGDALSRSVVAAIDAAASAGFVDKDRVGLLGHSFGGFSTASILARRSDRFKAGAAISGVYDFASAWGSRQSWDVLVDPDGYTFDLETKGYVENGQMRLGAPPWEVPNAYLRASPLYRAPDIKTPLMIMVGDLDLGTTNLQQSERLYAALRRTGNPAVMVRYWGQRHAQEDPGAVRDEWERLSAWFAHYLK